MKEIKDIIAAFEAAASRGQKSALATVVHVSGSSYRRPGARMLVTEEGKLTGAISGGCLEGDALRKALLAISQDKKKLVIYDTSDEDDAKLGVQLGCNGIVSILFEPLQVTDKQNPISLLKKSIINRSPSILVTGFGMQQQMHLGTTSPEALPVDMAAAAQAIAEAVLETGKSRYWEIPLGEGLQTIFFEYVNPPVSLVIAGAGNDVMPLVSMAQLLGWQVTVADGRATHANPNRFPEVEKLLVGKPENVVNELVLDNRTAMVLMTHNYNYDLDLLERIWEKEIPYIGLLGPATKRERMLQELERKGVQWDEQALQKIFGPSGLDLGAETSAEIALSIVAEIMAVMEDRVPANLRKKLQPIHKGSV